MKFLTTIIITVLYFAFAIDLLDSDNGLLLFFYIIGGGIYFAQKFMTWAGYIMDQQ